jgi:hypothetical protein
VPLHHPIVRDTHTGYKFHHLHKQTARKPLDFLILKVMKSLKVLGIYDIYYWL